MKLSTRSRYGVRLMLELALRNGQQPIFLRDVALVQDISLKYLSQLVIPLKSCGMIKALRGAHGGYVLARNPEMISLKEVVEALEKDVAIIRCVSKPLSCKRVSLCAAHDIWSYVSKRINDVLGGITLHDIVEIHKKKNSRLIKK